MKLVTTASVAALSTPELVWRGVGVGEIDLEAKPEKRDATIVKAVEKILKNYPPKSR